MLNAVRRMTGRIQLGFRTMSSNVAFGEKKTPAMRPKGLIAARASGAGMVVVAIADSSTTDFSIAFSIGAKQFFVLPWFTQARPDKFHSPRRSARPESRYQTART